MRRSGTGSGGGYGMNKNVEPRVRTGSGSKSTRPAGVAQIGTSIGDHVTERARGSGYRGEQLHNPDRNFQPVKFGNEVALNVQGGGPGKGRDVQRSGSQGTHGSVNPGQPNPGANKSIFPGFK